MKTTQLTNPHSGFTLLKTFLLILIQFVVLTLPAQNIQDSIIPCKWALIPPNFSVTETHWDEPQSFWQNGGHVPENLVNEDSTDFARAHIKLTGSATVRVALSDSEITFDEGIYVGFFIKSRVFRDSMFDGVTISTYLSGILQESFTGNDLIISHFPQLVNEPIYIGFITTRIFNEIELTLDTEGGRTHYDVLFAFVQDCNFNPNILPVTWLSFEAHLKGQMINLEWINTQEINNAGFEVERSGDGKIFHSIGIVSSARDFEDINVYSYTDEAPLKGVNYYRIKQTDFDGKVNYSTIRSVMFHDSATEIMIWPNPVSDHVTIDIGSREGGGTIKIVSSTGMIVLNKSFSPSDQRFSMDISSLDPGLYGVMIESSNEKYIHKLIVTR